MSGYRELGTVCSFLLAQRVIDTSAREGMHKLIRKAWLIEVEDTVRKGITVIVKVLPKIGARNWRPALDPSENMA